MTKKKNWNKFRRPLIPGWGKKFVTGICMYELAALYTPLPTFTELVHRIREKNPYLAILICGVSGTWAAHHLLLEVAGFKEAVKEAIIDSHE